VRFAAKRDANEPAIIAALQLAGWSIFQVGATGFPDLVAVRRGVSHFLEVKMAKGALTEAQVKLHRRMAAAGLAVHIVRTPDEALAAVGALKRPSLTPPVCAGCEKGAHGRAIVVPCGCTCHGDEVAA
jgi:hypothetical protein